MFSRSCLARQYHVGGTVLSYCHIGTGTKMFSSLNKSLRIFCTAVADVTTFLPETLVKHYLVDLGTTQVISYGVIKCGNQTFFQLHQICRNFLNIWNRKLILKHV